MPDLGARLLLGGTLSGLRCAQRGNLGTSGLPTVGRKMRNGKQLTGSPELCLDSGLMPLHVVRHGHKSKLLRREVFGVARGQLQFVDLSQRCLKGVRQLPAVLPPQLSR